MLRSRLISIIEENKQGISSVKRKHKCNDLSSGIVICYRNELFWDVMFTFGQDYVIIKDLMILMYTNWYMLCNLLVFIAKDFGLRPFFLLAKMKPCLAMRIWWQSKDHICIAKKEKNIHLRMFLRFFWNDLPN